MLSFVVLYFLVRVYIQDWHDLKRITPFFLSSSMIVVLYGILQNILFSLGRNPFEVMPGRPNGTFSEPDWYGLFLAFLLAVIFSGVYKYLCSSHERMQNAKIKIQNDNAKCKINRDNRCFMCLDNKSYFNGFKECVVGGGDCDITIFEINST